MALNQQYQSIPDNQCQTSSSQALRCGECRIPVSPWGFIGFCAECGLPLCENCLSTDHKVTSLLKAQILPLVIVNRFNVETMDTAVTLGKRCKARLDRDSYIEIGSGIVMGVIAFALFMLAMPYFGVAAIDCLPVCSSLIVALLVFFGAMIAVGIGREHKVGPYCPACGREALPILERAAKSGVDERTLSRVYHCTCGYSGPRLPFDGLWRFVDRNGPDLFLGTTLEKLAIHSYNVRHPDRPYRRY